MTDVQPSPLKQGRPRKSKTAKRPRYYEGKLYALLVKKFPDHVDDGGRLKVESLADAMLKARQSLYRWMERDQITPTVAKDLIALSKGTLTLEDLTPFVFA